MSEEFDPAIQCNYYGPFTDEFRARFKAVRDRHKWLSYSRIAKWAEWSPGYLGNCIRNEDGNVNPEFAPRLAAVVAKLEQAEPGSDLDALFAVPASAEPAAAPVVNTDSLEHAFAILRRHGFSITVACSAA